MPLNEENNPLITAQNIENATDEPIAKTISPEPIPEEDEEGTISDQALSEVRPHLSEASPGPSTPRRTPVSAMEELFIASTHLAATPIAYVPEDEETPPAPPSPPRESWEVQNLSCSSGECGDVSGSLTESLVVPPGDEQGAGEDEVVWSTLQKELSESEAATKIQARYRGHLARRDMARGGGEASETPHADDAPAAANVRHSGEFHDSLVLPPALLAAGVLLCGGGGEEADANAGPEPTTHRAEAAAEQQDDSSSGGGGLVFSEQGMPNSSGGEMSFLDKAATRIQATFRGFKTRNDLKTGGKGKSQPDTTPSHADHAAAAKIQAGFRGYKVRKEMKERGQSQVSPPPPTIAPTSEEEQSAVKIQAGVRGYLTRQRLKKEKEPPTPPSQEFSDEVNDAVVKIQAGFRGYKARQEVKNIRQNK